MKNMQVLKKELIEKAMHCKNAEELHCERGAWENGDETGRRCCDSDRRKVCRHFRNRI